MSKCPECNGTGEYVGFNSREECKPCRGTGAKDGITDALKSVFDFNDVRPKGDPIIGRDDVDLYDYFNEIPIGDPQPCVLGEPQITIGTIIHVYDGGWYEAEVQDIKNKVIHATDPCNTFHIPANGPAWNLTQGRWEYIKAGTPVWP